MKTKSYSVRLNLEVASERNLYDLLKADYKELNSKLKSELIHINSYNIMYKNKKYTLDKCISLYVANLKTCIINNSYDDFETPKIIKLERHRYE